MASEVDEVSEMESNVHLDERDVITEESTPETIEVNWNKEEVLIWIVNCLQIKIDEDKWNEYEYTGINDIEDDHLGIIGLTTS